MFKFLQCFQRDPYLSTRYMILISLKIRDCKNRGKSIVTIFVPIKQQLFKTFTSLYVSILTSMLTGGQILHFPK